MLDRVSVRCVSSLEEAVQLTTASSGADRCGRPSATGGEWWLANCGVALMLIPADADADQRRTRQPRTISGSGVAPTFVRSDAYYPNCASARAAGVAPIRRGQPGYSRKLDRDGDGVAFRGAAQGA